MKRYDLKVVMVVLALFLVGMFSGLEAQKNRKMAFGLKLGVPKQISPANNSHFTHYPRKLTVRWLAVKGANSYDVEIDCLNCRKSRQWDSQNGPAWKTASNVKGTAYSFTFVGDNQGRWRVRAGKGLSKSNWSTWWHFDFKTQAGGTTPSKKLPDLMVRDIKLVKGCKIQVTLKNIGTAGVPSSYYDLPNAVGVQMYNGGKPWGGIILKGFDPAGKLKSPGGTATHIWFPDAANLDLGGGTHIIKVEVDNGKVLTELSETNNTLTRSLTCKKLATGAVIGTPVATLMKNSISNIRLSPNSPASLNFDDKVNVWFDYYAREEVYIYARPMTNGSPTPNYAAHGSPLHPKGKGKGDGYFTIKKGAVTVDGVRFQMMNKSQSTVLFETIVPVKYKFPKMLIATIPGQTIAQIPLKAPNRFIMDFNEAHLIYKPATKTLQVITGDKVLAYGGDWEKCQLKPYLYHLRQKVWKGFYWKVNTSKREVYKVTGGSFCKLGGSEQKLNITVDTIGGSDTTPPESVFLRFNDAYLVYSVATKSIQIAAQSCVLSYGNDWDKCNLNTYTYHLKNKFAQTFFWKVDTNKKTAVEVTGGTFCQPGGSETPLNCSVRVFN